ncbi:hypothetical protein MRX96_056133 [Rhipicephalus microplus]
MNPFGPRPGLDELECGHGVDRGAAPHGEARRSGGAPRTQERSVASVSFVQRREASRRDCSPRIGTPLINEQQRERGNEACVTLAAPRVRELADNKVAAAAGTAVKRGLQTRWHRRVGKQSRGEIKRKQPTRVWIGRDRQVFLGSGFDEWLFGWREKLGILW